jgi:hypothetical protein
MRRRVKTIISTDKHPDAAAHYFSCGTACFTLGKHMNSGCFFRPFPVRLFRPLHPISPALPARQPFFGVFFPHDQ